MKSNLAELIRDRGIDQKTLAEKTGLSPTTVGKMCRGHFSRIDNHTVMALCRFFDLRSISDLIEIAWDEDDETLVSVDADCQPKENNTRKKQC